MDVQLEHRLRRAVQPIVWLLLTAQAIRLLAALAGGLTEIKQDSSQDYGIYTTGLKVATFGSAGDGVGVLLLILAIVAISITAPVGEPANRSWSRQVEAALWLLVLTAISVVVHAVGVSMQTTAFNRLRDWGQLVQFVGFDLAYLVVAVGAIYVLRRLRFAVADAAYAGLDDESSPAAVFAVDRRNGDVFAWPTIGTAVAEAPVYGVEDNEYEFFHDDGTVLTAGLVDGRVHFEPTDIDRSDDLIRALHVYAERSGVAVGPEEVNEPLAYVDPINRGHWLQHWPAWLRWIGRIARPPR